MLKSYFLLNNSGVKIEFSNFGGRIFSILIPDNEGHTDIVVGPPKLEDYLKDDSYMGAICGRFVNRIAKGIFKIDGEEYRLSINDGDNHLHGGHEGFCAKLWNVEKINLDRYASAYQLTYFSPDGEEGYPGNLDVKVIYALSDENEFLLKFSAVTDKATVINLTSHPYFNLNGRGSVLDHYLTVDADNYTPIGTDTVPTGEIKAVDNTPFDLRNVSRLGDIFEKYDFPGYDHNFVLNDNPGSIRKIAKLSEKNSGRSVELFADFPGLQIYTGQHFAGQVKGKDNKPLFVHEVLALEPQNFPDAPNHENFPNAVLRSDEVYERTIMYRFNF